MFLFFVRFLDGVDTSSGDSVFLQLKPQEGKAVFLLRKAMQKLTAATPENFEASQKDFEETIKVQLEAALPATCRLFSIDFSISAFSYQPGVKSARQLEAKKIT